MVLESVDLQALSWDRVLDKVNFMIRQLIQDLIRDMDIERVNFMLI
jgi:hypothetical protein